MSAQTFIMLSMTIIFLAIAGLIAFNAVVALYGADTRPGFDERREDRPPTLL